MASAVEHSGAYSDLPQVRRISLNDLRVALTRGMEDFREIPSQAVFLCLIYPLVGLFLWSLMVRYDTLPLLFPLVAGFALIGPFAAVGLYELSRRRELGLESNWQHAFDVFSSPAKWSIFGLAVLLLVIFATWVSTAHYIYVRTMGDTPLTSVTLFARKVFLTKQGWELILAGNSIGFLFALVTLMVSAVSFPLALDRKVDPATAIITSVRAVLYNPVQMLAWGFVVALALVAGSIPFLFGLAIVMPVLGHATWHLYRRVVV